MILFDCLATKDLGPILDRPLTERRAALEGVAEQLGRDARVRVTPFTHDRQEAERWLARAQDVLDGSSRSEPTNLTRPAPARCSKLSIGGPPIALWAAFAMAVGGEKLGPCCLGCSTRRVG